MFMHCECFILSKKKHPRSDICIHTYLIELSVFLLENRKRRMYFKLFRFHILHFNCFITDLFLATLIFIRPLFYCHPYVHVHSSGKTITSNNKNQIKLRLIINIVPLLHTFFTRVSWVTVYLLEITSKHKMWVVYSMMR